MEDQIYRTIKDSIKVMKDTLSKDLIDIHSMLCELVGTLTISKPGTVEFQRFCGENPELWISQAERSFKFYEITENHKLDLASCYLDGTTLQWYQWLFQNKELADWKYFTEKVLIRFHKCHLKLPKESLSNLQEWSNITNSFVLQNYKEKSERKRKMNAHKVFDKKLSGYFSTLFAETQSDIPIEMRYANAIDLDHGSNEQHTHEIETLEGAISANEIIPYAECGNSYGGEKHDKGNLLNVGATTFVVHVQGIASNLTYGGEEHDEGNLLLNLSATTFVVQVQKIALNLYVWDPGISFEFQILTSSNKIVKARALFEEIKKRKSFLLEKLYNWEHVGGVKI
ncbi:hypothetical protein KY284_011359 [Solanum tuberosum]|nr:hypothetical protein KY284_011359 [Solanum tuberosum]